MTPPDTATPPIRAVFLDRDGVLIRTAVEDGTPRPAGSLAEVELLPGVVDAVRRLKERGFRTIVVSNQPDVARGRTPQERVEQINAWLRQQMPLDEICTCYHDDRDQCGCRKPKPGLLLAAAERHGIALASSFMVGDRWRDVDAGAAAGCRSILIDYGYGERAPQHPPVATVKGLPAAADWILQHA